MKISFPFRNMNTIKPEISSGHNSWKPDQTQLKIVHNYRLTTEQRESQIIMKHRKQIWEKGGIEDIKRGDYLVASREYADRYNMSLELFDYGPFHADNEEEKEGWTLGLRNNISMEIGRTHVLVMDNHNFAAAFIMDMFKKGLIYKESKMIHIDAHSDFLDLKQFWLNPFKFTQMNYLLKHTNIESWQVPLLKSGVVAEKKYKWFDLDYKYKWHESDPFDEEYYFKYKYISDTKKFFGNIASDIVDIDIDVLDEIDSELNKEQQAAVRKGKLPSSIMSNINVLSCLARKAKVVTIATSPCWIDQPRAIIYTKELLRQMEAAKE